MMRLAFALAIVISAVLAQPQVASFAPFGRNAGDALLAVGDDNFVGPISFPFRFYGTNYTGLWVNNNGILSFNGGISAFTPVGMSGASFPAIAPFWADVDTRGPGSETGGNRVWYRATTDATLLNTWSAKVSSSFHGIQAFIVTWDRVGYYASKVNKINSFQVVMIGDQIGNSWVFFNYNGLQWTTGDASGGSNGVGGTPASVGFAKGDRQTYVQTSSSLTADVVNTPNMLTQVNLEVIVIAQTCGNGVQEGTEQCDGGACCTSTCTYASSSSVCRAASDSCDLPETCSGSSSDCPSDAFASSTSICRVSQGVCDVDEFCTGSTAACPADVVASNNTVCRPAANDCDIAETCTGSAVACPADQLSNTPRCFCGRQNGTQPQAHPDYFCSPTGDLSFFYMCMYGDYAAQSTSMRCSAGTSCGCPSGNECSCGGSQSPCVWENTLQQC